MYGWRARLGLVVPSVNSTVEPEATMMLPDGVALHASRVPFEEPALGALRSDSIRGMTTEVERASRTLVDCSVDAVGYACTTASFLDGYESDVRYSDEMANLLGVPFLTAAQASVMALRALGVSRVVLITPYSADVVQRQIEYLHGAGIAVAEVGGAPRVASSTKGSMPPWDAYRFTRQLKPSAGDGIFVSCTNWSSLTVLEMLERDLGLPSISSNSALVWSLLRTSGVGERVSGFGQLLTLAAGGMRVGDDSG